ncbi:50S ribosomal protein L9 [Gammaproteobacteria bacterium SCGC AG-212-F23]|nr:50S ribosomal protein L9 [Gammaproteobacteria bacterium SCGC AG-212-F23]
MEVILLERIRNLGALGQTVKVKPGYGRNFLVPKGKAVYATEANLAKFELRRAELEKIQQQRLQAAEARQKALADLGIVTITAKTGEEGKLFGSITVREISKAITDAGVVVEKSEIDLPAGVIRQIGEYEITLELDSDVKAKIKLNIVPEA